LKYGDDPFDLQPRRSYFYFVSDVDNSSVDEDLREFVMARNSSDNGNTLVGVSIALSVLQIGLVAARFYTRRLQRERYGWDDWVMLIALVCVFFYPTS